MNKIGINTWEDYIKELWVQAELPINQLHLETFYMADQPKICVRSYSSCFKTIEDFVDEAWEKNRL